MTRLAGLTLIAVTIFLAACEDPNRGPRMSTGVSIGPGGVKPHVGVSAGRGPVRVGVGT